jgi:hypothetical protein
MGWKGRFGFEDNNDWGGMSGKDLKSIKNGVKKQVWI